MAPEKVVMADRHRVHVGLDGTQAIGGGHHVGPGILTVLWVLLHE
jgi:hypothetical protein